MKESEEIVDPQCKDLNKTECVFLKNNYNSIDFAEVEQIEENDDDKDSTDTGYRPPIGSRLNRV